MNRKVIFAVFLIFLLGLALRFYRLSLNIPELYIDETTGQYLMRTSVLYPPLIGSSPIQRLLVNHLSFTWILGLNPFGARSAAALFSSFIPLTIFLLFSQIKHKSSVTVALIGALLSALLPWSFLIGRISHVHIPIIVLLTCLSSYFFLKANQFRHYLIALFFLGLAGFYYPSVIFVAPFYGSLILYFAAKELNQKQRQSLFAAIFVLVLVIGVIFTQKYHGLNPSSRGVDLAIWRDPNTLFEINNNRGAAWLSAPSAASLFAQPKLLAPLVYNKLTGNLAIFTHNYLSFFSPEWLFLKGDSILRHSTGQIGYFYPVLIPLFLFGVFRFFKNADQKAKLLFTVWILASPLTAALTKDGAGYLLRAITMMPFLTYFVAVGLVESTKYARSKVGKSIYILFLAALIGYSALYFFFGYFHAYPNKISTARAYEYGFKELSDFQVESNNASMLIIWDGYYPFGHFLFWQNIPPQEYKKHQLAEYVFGESHFYQPLPNLYFVKPYKTTDVEEFISKRQPAFLVLPDRYYLNYPPDLVGSEEKTVKVIYYPDGEPNFAIYSL